MAASKTSRAWDALDQRHRIRDRLAIGEVIAISADEIKTLSGREPRLMTKFDTRESRPAVLANATVLPVINGNYVVLPGDGYHNVEPIRETKRWPLPPQALALKTLPWGAPPKGESQALDMALAAGILGDFFDETTLHLTIRGRRRSPRFDFEFKCGSRAEPISVDRVQIEVDSGLEGNRVHLIEGKIGSRENFHIRQLYYPLRMWKEKVGTKEVTTSLLTWSNKRFALRRYEFDPLTAYNSIRLAAAVDYVIEGGRELPSLRELLNDTKLGSLPSGVPFPQADRFIRVIDVVDAVGSGLGTRHEIARRLEFDQRQAHYYGNAGTFLGLLVRSGHAFSLTDDGRIFVASAARDREAILATRIAATPVFREALEWILDHRSLPDYKLVEEWIATKTGLSGKTPRRRAASVLAWARWVAVTLGAEVVDESKGSSPQRL